MQIDTFLLNHITHGVSISDMRSPDQPLIFVNRAFEELTGYSADEVVGQNCRFLNAHRPDQPGLDTLRAAIRDGVGCTVLLENVRKDGTVFWNQLSLSPIYDEAGALTHFIGTQVEMTERVGAEKALRQAEHRFRRLVSNVPGMVYQFVRRSETSFEYTYVSEGCRELLGIEPADLERDAGRMIAVLHPDDVASFAAAVNASAEQLTPWIWEGRVARRTGDMRWVRGMSRPEWLPDGTIRWDGMMFDITESRQAQEIIEAQAAAISELSTPVIPFDDRTLVMPLIGAIDSQRAQQVIETLLTGVSTMRASTAIIDITGVSVVDTQVADALLRAAQAVKLLGAQAVLTGIRPEVAQTLVQLGVDLGAIITRSTLQSGIAFAMKRG